MRTVGTRRPQRSGFGFNALGVERQRRQRFHSPGDVKQLVDAKGKPVEGLPEEGGYFEMILPKALLEAKSLTIEWVDFYR